ncbi:MAG TPA: BACON domain-containing carbohydrate-binding protein [Tenuifilaceae bacterium]|nr:BACON domain-containing carbohydrate-binding protein [Tenuifilaceae bacterium]
MKKTPFFYLLLILVINFQQNYAQEPDWTRVLQFNTLDLQYGNVVTADAENAYMAGSVCDQITFDGTSFTSVGTHDLIIVKVSNTGVTAWKKQFNAQANGDITPNAIKVDANNNIYISATFTGTATIGNSTITSGTLYNAFIAKFDINGNGLWATAFLAEGTGSSKIAIDDTGNSYLISSSSKLLKFDNSGVKLWEQCYSDKTLQAIAVYGSNLYIGGDLQEETITFGSLTLTPQGGFYTGYLVKADLNGVYNDSLVVRGSTWAYGSTICDIAICNSGDLIITGGYTQDLILGTETITNPSYSFYTYIAKCNTDFDFEWVKSSTSNTNALFNFRLFIDNSNNIYEYGLSNRYFNYDSFSSCPDFGQFLFQFDPNGDATNTYCLQNRSSYDRTIVTPEGKILTTGSYDVSGDPLYGNLYINQYDDETLEWQKISTNTLSGSAEVNFVKHDSLGNTFIKSRATGYCNYFGTTINSINSVTLISKHDIAGNLLWLNQLVDLKPNTTLAWRSFGPGFILDKDDNVLTIGRFENSLNIGNQTFINQNTLNDGYVAKYSSSGQFEWAVQLNANGQIITIDGITADSEGNAIVSGSFKGEITISSHTISAGTGYGVFIIKFDANGNYLWAQGFPIGDLVYSAMVSVDKNDNIYLAGEMYDWTTNLLTFGTVSTPQTNEDGAVVLVKFDTDGNPQWANTYGGAIGASGADSFQSNIKTDADGNTYLWGMCQNNAVFGTTTLTNPFNTIPKYSYYLTKINSAGDVIWANAIYESYDDSNHGFNFGDLLDLDNSGNIYVGGHFTDSISIAGIIYKPEGLNDFFLAQYSNNGGFQWIKTLPSDDPRFGNISAFSVFDDNVLTLGGYAGKESTIGNFDIVNTSGSSCIVATLGYLPFLNVSTETLTITAEENSTASFVISSNVSWTAESNEEWLTASSNAGSGNEALTLTASANPAISSRTATVTILGDKVIPKAVIVTQDAALPNLNVSTNTLSIAAEDSSTATFDITSNIDWTAESDQSWLTVSNNASFGNETVTLTATANPAINSRTANVTVSGNGVSTQTIIVTQDGASAVLAVSADTLTIATADSTSVMFDITSNISWIVLSSQSWLAVSSNSGSGNKTITLSATENLATNSRTATVTVYGTGVDEQVITVIQSPALPNLSVSTNILIIKAADNSTSSFNITSNTDWTIESNQSWFTVSKDSGSGNESITITAEENPTINTRTATLIVNGTDDLEQVITVIQNAAVPYLTVSSDSLSIEALNNSSAIFNIFSNVSWVLVSNQDWLSISNCTGSCNETVTLSATINPTTSVRAAIISIFGTSLEEQTITVVQEAAEPSLTVSTNLLTIAAPEGSTATFDITSNINWTAESNQEWLTVNSSSGSGNKTIALTAAENPTISTRTATVSISGNDEFSQYVVVTQEASEPLLSVSINTLTISDTEGSTTTFDITSNISWLISCNQDWLTISNTAGAGDETITLTVEANPSNNPRTATITIYGTGVTEQTITIIQYGVTTSIDESSINYNANIYPNPNNGKFILELNNFNGNDDISVTIVNSLGVVNKKFTISNISTNYTQEIDLGNLAKGLYFITLKTNKILVTKSLLIQ